MSKSIYNIEESIRALKDILPANEKILVAVSGGPDSLALLHTLYTHRELLKLSDLAVVHYDHGLRDESSGEAKFVSDYCQSLGIHCFIGKSPKGTLYEANRGSMQEAARLARYQFIESTANAWNTDYIATAHHQDDQIETVLINIFRGTGIDGLRGIPYQRGKYIRPFLNVPRKEIEQYCIDHNLDPRRDQSNNDPSHYLRNKIRLRLLPELEAEYHSGVKNAILRLSRNAEIDSDYLQRMTLKALDDAVSNSANDSLRISINKLLLNHAAIQRRLVRLAILKVRGSCEGVTEEHIETVLQFCSSDIQPYSITISNPLVHITRRGPELVVEAPKEMEVTHFDIKISDLPLNTAVTLPNGWRIVIMPDNEAAPDKSRPSINDIEFNAVIDLEKANIAQIHIRSWQSGDRITPIGMHGNSKKVQDLFVNAKLTLKKRSDWCVAADSNEVIWVPGIALSERVKIDESTKDKLHLLLLLPAFFDTIDLIEP